MSYLVTALPKILRHFFNVTMYLFVCNERIKISIILIQKTVISLNPTVCSMLHHIMHIFVLMFVSVAMTLYASLDLTVSLIFDALNIATNLPLYHNKKSLKNCTFAI